MANKFTTNKYKKNTYKKSLSGRAWKNVEYPYSDGSDAMANIGELVVSFEHVPSKTKVYFKAFITAFNETYNSDWSTEEVFGRVDPLYLFGQTEKRISLALKVPSATESEAYENLGRIQTLSQFLYPTYANPSSATTLTQSPQIRLKVMNLLHATRGDDRDLAESEKDGRLLLANDSWDATLAEWLYTMYGQAADDNGMLGYMSSLVINHNLENGTIGVIEKAPNTILPKMIDINIEFSPIHEHTQGWDEKNRRMDPTSPYGVILRERTDLDKPATNGNAMIADANNERDPETPLPGAPPPKPPNQAKQDIASAERQKALSKFHSGCQKRNGLTEMSVVKRRVDCYKDGDSLAHIHMDNPSELHWGTGKPFPSSKDLPE